MSAAERLLRDYATAKVSLISERSVSMTEDGRILTRELRGRAADLGIEWSDDIVPEWMRDCIAADEEVSWP